MASRRSGFSSKNRSAAARSSNVCTTTTMPGSSGARSTACSRTPPARCISPTESYTCFHASKSRTRWCTSVTTVAPRPATGPGGSGVGVDDHPEARLLGGQLVELRVDAAERILAVLVGALDAGRADLERL